MLWRPSVKTPRSVPYGQATHSETGKNDEESSENDKAGLETKNLANGGFVVPGVFKINNSKYFGIEASPLKNWVHPDNMKK